MTIEIQTYDDEFDDGCDDEVMGIDTAELLFNACCYMDKKAFIAEPTIFNFYRKRLTRLYFSDDEMTRCVAVRHFLRLGLDISVHKSSMDCEMTSSYFKKGDYWYSLYFKWKES